MAPNMCTAIACRFLCGPVESLSKNRAGRRKIHCLHWVIYLMAMEGKQLSSFLLEENTIGGKSRPEKRECLKSLEGSSPNSRKASPFSLPILAIWWRVYHFKLQRIYGIRHSDGLVTLGQCARAPTLWNLQKNAFNLKGTRTATIPL